MANILGININEINAGEAQKKIIAWLAGEESGYVVTPNPEIILKARQDEEFFYILNKANLSVADGFGLKIAGWIMGEKIIRVTGSDLTISLLEEVARKNIKVVVLSWQAGLSSAIEIKTALQTKFPDLQCLVIEVDREPALKPDIIQAINNFSPQLLFSALGFPYQEKIIYHNLKKMPSVKAALGVGGSFDFLTGRAKRAPRSFSFLGLEWLWRLIKQPRRFRRIFQATVVFLSAVLRARFISRYRYRSNVACLLYKNTPTGPQILITQREDDDNHWQLPQGETDGENIEKAGKRELKEELNALSLKTTAVFKNVHRYKFADRSKQLPSYYETKKFKFDYKGQSQGLYIAEFLGDDSEIKIKFWDHVAWKWVPAEKLIESVHPVRQKGAQAFMQKFKSINLNSK